MKRICTIVLLCAAGPAVSLLAACEGEPPIQMPENPSGTGSFAAVPPGPVASSEPAAPASMGTTACPPPPNGPNDSGSAAPVTSAASDDAGTPPATPEVAAAGDIAGTVTTKPATLAAYAVVYLEDAPKDDAPAHLQTVTISNKRMSFSPFVSVLGVGGKVVFLNDDPFPHNVFSPDGEKFNIGNIAQNGSHQRVFDHSGAYTLLCNLHPGMLGYLLVTPTTHYAKADAKGNYAIKHIPAGTYRVTAWAPRQIPVTQSIAVASGDNAANFDLHR